MFRLQEILDERDMKQKDLSEALHLPKQTIHNYAACKRQPDFDTIDQLCDFFGVTADYLLGRSSNPAPAISRELKTPAAARVIPIPPQLVAALQTARAGEQGSPAQIARRTVIHGEDGEPLTYSAFRRKWDAVTVRSATGGKELGDKIRNHKITVTIPRKITPHLLRHTYITRLILGGVDLKRVQYLAGHDDPEITLKIYTSLMQHRPEDLISSVLAVFGPEGQNRTP